MEYSEVDEDGEQRSEIANERGIHVWLGNDSVAHKGVLTRVGKKVSVSQRQAF